MVEDRDTAYLWRGDQRTEVGGGDLFTLELPDLLPEYENEEKWQWLMKEDFENPSLLKVTLRSEFDYNADNDGWWPIPSPIFMLPNELPDNYKQHEDPREGEPE
jgi:hypothetical protein